MSDPITTAGVLEKANALKAEMTTLRGKITDNRKLAKMLVANGFATPEEAAAIEKLYPEHVAKPKPAAAPAGEPAPDQPPAGGEPAPKPKPAPKPAAK